MCENQLSAQHHGTLGVFKNVYLRTMDSDKEFTCDEIMEEEGKVLSDYAMHAIKNKEVIDAS